MIEKRILLVDDDPDIRMALSVMLQAEGYTITEAGDAADAIPLLDDNSYDVILTDLIMPKKTGMDLLHAVKEKNIQTPVVFLTGQGSISSAVEAMRSGAFDYITKPFNENEVIMVVSKAFETTLLKMENKRLREELQGRYKFENIIAVSPQMSKVFDVLNQVMETDVNILIFGDSGTGKELIARAIHYNSPRRNKPFVTINCPAIPHTLLESEFFGHEKNAFTGAANRRIGKFEAADTGTVFMDEIGDMDINLQAKILRVLEQKEFERVGGSEQLNVDVRILAATNRNLEDEVKQNRFREDLFFRLNVINITLPPLREREGDILHLSTFFLEKFNEKYKKDILGFDEEVLAAFQDYLWPGNVRELENLVERAVIVCRGQLIDRSYFPDKIFDPTAPENLVQTRAAAANTGDLIKAVESLEKTMIIEAMKENNWVQSRTAKALNVSERILGYKIKKYEIKKPG